MDASSLLQMDLPRMSCTSTMSGSDAACAASAALGWSSCWS